MMNRIFAIFSSLFCSYVYAGLPPTTLKGQSEASAITTFNFQAPYNTATTSGGSTRYLDTSNRNLLLNSSFEASTATTSWTATTATGASESSIVTDGRKSYKLTFSASTGNMAQSVTPTVQMDGVNMEASCKVKTILSTAQVCALNAGSELQCQNVSGNAGWVATSVYFAGPSSGSVGVNVKTSSSTTGDIYIDDCYVGPARNIGVGTVVGPWVAYTPTFGAGFGTVTGINFKSRRNGARLEIIGTFMSGTTSGTTASVSIGYNGVDQNVTADLNVIPAAISGQLTQVGSFTNSSQADTVTTLIEGGTSVLRFGSNQSALGSTPITASGVLGNSKQGYINASIPITGWSAQPQTISVDQSNYDWTPYTPIFNGMGTVTNIEMQHKREGSDLLIRGKFTVGTVTASEARVGLPTSLTSADTTKIPSIQIAGHWAMSAVQNSYMPILVEPSTAYVVLTVQNGTYGGLTKQNGDTIINAGATVTVQARIPIQGWYANQNAPLLVGSVTSNSTGLNRIERARVVGACSSSPCTLNTASGGVSSITRTGGGDYVINFVVGTFSGVPSCTGMTQSVSALAVMIIDPSRVGTATSVPFQTYNFGGTPVDQGYDIICMGPK